MRARLRLGEPLPEAFACANDQTAVGVIYALHAAGLRVPEDVLVTGFDDITLTRYFKPPLTTIRQSGSLLGEVAVDALLATLDNAELAAHHRAAHRTGRARELRLRARSPNRPRSCTRRRRHRRWR